LRKFSLIMEKSQTFPSPLTGEGKGGGENILTPPTLILPHKGGGDFLYCLPMNSKGISVLFLVIAMLVMVTIGYVFSYLIPTKQKSVIFPIYSNQAFFIAQSGVEFAIRYCEDQGWRGTTDGIFDLNRLNGISRPLGNGTFTLAYNNAIGDILTSTGQITGSSENRAVRVSNFLPFLRLIFDPASPVPCRTPPAGTIPGGLTRNQAARFYIKNVRTTDITLRAFSASWTGGGLLRRIYMDAGAGWALKYQAPAGSYVSGSGSRNFNQPFPNDRQTITPNQVITVLLYFNFNLAGDSDFVTTFYTAAGDAYTFNLDAAGNQLPTC